MSPIRRSHSSFNPETLCSRKAHRVAPLGAFLTALHVTRTALSVADILRAPALTNLEVINIDPHLSPDTQDQIYAAQQHGAQLPSVAPFPEWRTFWASTRGCVAVVQHPDVLPAPYLVAPRGGFVGRLQHGRFLASNVLVLLNVKIFKATVIFPTLEDPLVDFFGHRALAGAPLGVYGVS